MGDVEEIAELKQAIDTNDVLRVQALMTRNPALHRAPLGYGKDGPLTWVAECRVPWEPPRAERLAMAEWMIAHGSDVHQGGDGPLMRAALNGDRIPMMELLVAHGADVNARWHGHFPIVFAPCESCDPDALRWLLDHGANPNCRDPRHSADGQPFPGTALDYLVASYARSAQRLSACIDVLLAAGGETKYDAPPVLDVLRGSATRVMDHVESDPELLNRRFHELDFGMTGGRRLTLRGGTLLHVAVEYGQIAVAMALLDRGADVNARATVDESGVGGQTPIFHAVSQFDDEGFEAAQLLIERGAELTLRVKLPGDYERPGETVECTPLGYALRFGGSSDRRTVALLRQHGAIE
ncbi:MAG: ankyrin repeat domain-containing protein [Bryobacterales bacterium]|nr:ankyrin repeat domain-containing protein [Bryobacterales bacterium]